MLSAQQVIELLQLEPLAFEGGYYRETHRAALSLPEHALPEAYGSQRNAGTAIYYLVTPESFSAMHRVVSDEVFHFYAGDPVEMLHLRADGSGEVVMIGNDLAAGHRPQVVVPGGVWQGCRLVAGGQWALMGCTVSPGFDFADFEIGKREELSAAYPEFAKMIAALTLE